MASGEIVKLFSVCLTKTIVRLHCAIATVPVTAPLVSALDVTNDQHKKACVTCLMSLPQRHIIYIINRSLLALDAHNYFHHYRSVHDLISKPVPSPSSSATHIKDNIKAENES
ncbi:hypothetical protein PoB_005962500 [Plakobranchus ocellatus]|uniref:Uncharacterized protein n=1 Tax=Plakobranchus ocellatus TaxID=259542 RepID=A0AAV4CMK7_9GAST|nr:hypothetical protein PoB_005962500 [Plakobranchus ocellatus]